MIRVSQAVKQLHAGLSTVQRDFLEFVERTPACLQRSSFAGLAHQGGLYDYPLQPWPTFVGGAKLDEMRRVSTGLCTLIKSLPERLFGLDPRRLAAFYRLAEPAAERIVRALRDTGAASQAIARGDFIDSPAGLRCLEFNICGNVGGWQTALWTERYFRVPLIAAFLDSLNQRCGFRDTLQLFLAHALATMQAREGRSLGWFNLAVLADLSFPGATAMATYLDDQYRLARARLGPGIDGRVLLCDYLDLREESGALWLGRNRLHGIVEQYRNEFSPPVAECFAQGAASFFNGPLSLIFHDKRNLALLSRHHDEDASCFDQTERRLLRCAVPWTRIVAAESTCFRGERVFLPELVCRERPGMVLKPATELGGKDVHLGRTTPAGVWLDLVRRALAAGDWVVQEHVESNPYLYQADQEGCALHDVIWGLFVFGTSYGGAFLRMQPKDREAIVNSQQGATEGVVLEVFS